jgi:hypothetical protein
MPVSQTKSLLSTADEHKIVEQLKAVARGKRLPASIDPAKLVQETRSHRIRDAAALALLDLGYPGTAELLIPLIATSETTGHNGTLLYVLNELKAIVPLGKLIGILVSGKYEAREEALMLLERAQSDDAELSRALIELDRLRQSEDEELSAVAAAAIDRLTPR